jgi:hypothetical protein
MFNHDTAQKSAFYNIFAMKVINEDFENLKF